MILDKEVPIRWAKNNKDYYIKKGYQYTKSRDTFLVKVEDLHPNSKWKVHFKCDYCNDEDYDRYSKCHCETTGKFHCSKKECRRLSRRDSNMIKYGVPHHLLKKEIHDKQKQTNLKRYGCEKPLQNEKFKEKAKNTYRSHYGKEENYEGYLQLQEKMKKVFLENYGVEYAWLNPEVKNKVDHTMMERYGVIHPMDLEENRKKQHDTRINFSQEKKNAIQEKRKATCLERYGVDCVSKSQEVKKKMSESMKKSYIEHPERIEKQKATTKKHYGVEFITQDKEMAQKIGEKARITNKKNGTIKASRQQQYLSQLLGGECNYPFKQFMMDIFIQNKNIFIEYDGGGHELSIKLKAITKKQFHIKQKERDDFVTSFGYKIIRYISDDDVIFQDNIIISLFDFCYNYMQKSNEKIIYIDIDNLCIRTRNQTLKHLTKDGKIIL